MDWIRRPQRIKRLEFTEFSRLRGADLDALARSTRDEWHCNVEWVQAVPGIAGLAHTVLFQSPNYPASPGLGDLDFFREYLAAAHRQDVRVVAYVNMHWYTREFGAQHPDWECRDAAGRSIAESSLLYGTGTSFCLNSPWREWAYRLIGEVASLGPDGIFLDGTVTFPGYCYCDHREREFHKQTGHALPHDNDWHDPVWREFVEFRFRSNEIWIRGARAAVNAVNPDIVFYVNGARYDGPWWWNARDNAAFAPHQDMIGAEGYVSGDLRQTSLWSAAFTAKLLAATGKPTVTYLDLHHEPWEYVALPAVEIQANIAQVVACGSNPLMTLFDETARHDADAVVAVGETCAFLEKNDAYLTNTQSEARVAIYVSRSTATHYFSDEPAFYQNAGTMFQQGLATTAGIQIPLDDQKRAKQHCDDQTRFCLHGFFEALEREHIPVDFIHELDSDSRYRVIVLPNAACLSEAELAGLRGYVENGGGLIATFETGCYDERGRRRTSFVPWFGLQAAKGLLPPTTIDFVRGEGRLIPRPPYHRVVETASDVVVPLHCCDPLTQVYSALSQRDVCPALMQREFGKGRIAYFPGLVGAFYHLYQLPAWQKVIAQTVDWAAQGAASCISVEAPESVGIEVRSQNDGARLLVHLINMCGEMRRPMTKLLPVRDLHLSLTGRTFRSIRSLRGEKVSQRGDRWTLERLERYDILVIE